MKIITAVIITAVIICIFASGCINEKTTDELKPVTTNISGEWRSVSSDYTYGNGFESTDNIMEISFEQKDRLFYFNNSGQENVGVLCNKEGDVFIVDLSSEDSLTQLYGRVIGDNMILSITGSFDDEIFAESDYFVREGTQASDVFEFTPLKERYTLKNAYQINGQSKEKLTGDNLIIENQMNGLIYGTIEQDVDGKIVPRKFAAAGYYKTEDTEVYQAVINKEFWVMTYSPKTGIVEFDTAAHSEFSKDISETVAASRIYYSDEFTSIDKVPSLFGEWTSISTEKININRVDEIAYSGTINIVNQDGRIFLAGFGTENTNENLLGGSVYIPEETQFFMRGDSNEGLFLIEGWVEGDTLYACTVSESFGVKSASIDVCKKSA